MTLAEKPLFVEIRYRNDVSFVKKMLVGLVIIPSGYGKLKLRKPFLNALDSIFRHDVHILDDVKDTFCFMLKHKILLKL